MKKLLFVAFLFISFISFGQNVHTPNSTNWINVVTSGVDNTGGSDVTAAVTALLKKQTTLYFPSGTYLIKELKLLDSMRMVGDDAGTFFKVTTNDTVITTGNFNYIQGITFIGSSGSLAQIGINMDSTYGSKVFSCHFYSMGNAIRIARNGNRLDLGGFHGNQVQFCDGMSNVYGLKIDVRGEYNEIDAVSFSRSTNTAFYNAGGNNSFTNCDGNDGGTGFWLEGSNVGNNNDGHASTSSCHFNHNTRSLFVHGSVYGFTFSATQFYFGRMELDSSVQILFQGCDIDCTGDSLVLNNITLSGFQSTKFHSTLKVGVYSTNSISSVNVTNGGVGGSTIDVWDIINNKHTFLTNINSVFGVGSGGAVADNTTRINLVAPTVTKTGNADLTRDISIGSSRFDFTNSTSADNLQIYGSTARGREFTILDSATQYGLLFFSNDKLGIGLRNSASSTEPKGVIDLTRGRQLPGYAPIKFHAPYSTVTGATGTGSVATITLGIDNGNVWWPGDSIVVTGVSPSGYNGRYKITATNGSNTVSYANATSSALTVAGKVNTLVLLSTPESQTVEVDPSHIYYTDSAGVRWQLDQQSGAGTPTLQQVLTAGSTLTGNNTIINGGFNLAITGTGKTLIGSSTDNSTALAQITSTSAQLALHYDATHYTTFAAASGGGIVITTSSSAGFQLNLGSTGSLNLNTVGSGIAIAEGSGGRVGNVSLVAGTKTFAVSGSGSSTRCFVTLSTQAGTTTTTAAYEMNCSSGNCTISAITSAGTNTVNTLDTSNLNYFCIN